MRQVILATCLCVYIFVVVEGMYICNTGNFGNDPLCLCFCCCRGYVIGYWLGSVVRVLLGFNEGTKLESWDGKVLGITLKDLFGI